MSLPPEYLNITYSHEEIRDDDNGHENLILPFARSPLLTAKMKSSTKLTQGDDVKRVYQVDLNMDGFDYTYIPGDVIGIMPENDSDELHSIMDALDLLDSVDRTYTLRILEGTTKKKPSIPLHIPTKGSLRNTFKRYIDIRSVPKKLFLKVLAEYTTNGEEKQELLSLTDPKQSDKYSEFIANDGARLLTILRKFQSCKPPVERLLEHLPSLKPRYYTISSTMDDKPANCVSIIFAVLDFDEGVKGVCTGCLEKCLADPLSTVRFYFRQSSEFLKFLHEDKNIPLILIGPGTGVSPYIGLLRERYLKGHDAYMGDMVLFFGCRYADRDFLYKDWLNVYLSSGLLSDLYTAFSRDTNQKVYVQDKIKEHGGHVCDLILNQNAFVRLCGDAKLLLKSVDDVLVDVLVKHGDMDQGQANDYIVEMKQCGRYKMDIWT